MVTVVNGSGGLETSGPWQPSATCRLAGEASSESVLGVDVRSRAKQTPEGPKHPDVWFRGASMLGIIIMLLDAYIQENRLHSPMLRHI